MHRSAVVWKAGYWFLALGLSGIPVGCQRSEPAAETSPLESSPAVDTDPDSAEAVAPVDTGPANPTLGLPTAPFYALVPIGAAFLCIELMLQMAGMIASLRKG